MRGQQVLFEQVFTSAPELTVSKQGRSEELHARRNEMLVDRFYYYGKFTDKRYEGILETLRDEFCIEKFTIQERIHECYDQLLMLKQKTDLSAKYFKEKWPHLVW